MGFVGRTKQTVTVPELRSHFTATVRAQCAFTFNPVCAATAVFCDLGPAYVNNPGLTAKREADWQRDDRAPLRVAVKRANRFAAVLYRNPGFVLTLSLFLSYSFSNWGASVLDSR